MNQLADLYLDRLLIVNSDPEYCRSSRALNPNTLSYFPSQIYNLIASEMFNYL
jgi:hypothetical protein